MDTAEDKHLRESNAKLRRAVDWLQKASDVATTRYNQLYAATCKTVSDAELAKVVRECVRSWQYPQSNETAELRQKLEAANRSNQSLREILRSIPGLAIETFDYWDADNDMKVGKILKALAGKLPGYRVDIDRIIEAGREPETMELPNGSESNG